MRILRSKPLGVLLIAVTALPVAGCARNRAKGDTPYVARDVGTLYTAAKRRLDRGSYKEAAALFDEVERQHPYSVWARRAQLMSAFSYYLGKEYTQSIQSAQRFLSVHPGNRDAPYAYYLVALSYYEQITDVTRDQKITRQALDALGELTRRYPNTRYASDARLKIDLVNDHLAGKEMEVGRFYQRRGQWLASSMRFRRVVDDYQTTAHAPEALMRLTESYLALGVREEAQKSAAVLGRNYPASNWYERAYKLVREYPASPIAPVPPGQAIIAANAPGTQGNIGMPGVNDTAKPARPEDVKTPNTPDTTEQPEGGGAGSSTPTGGSPTSGTTPGM